MYAVSRLNLYILGTFLCPFATNIITEPSHIQTLGSPTEDMFTTVQNTKVTKFCLQFQMTVLSQHPLTTLEGLVDAISTAEQGLSEAPLHLGKVILITLWWPAQPWFPHLV